MKRLALVVFLHLLRVEGFSLHILVGQQRRATFLKSQRTDLSPPQSLDGDEGNSNNNNEEEMGNVAYPSGVGISVSDEMEASQRERFVTQVVPVPGLRGVAQLVTTTAASTKAAEEAGSSPYATFEPTRYLVALSLPKEEEEEKLSDRKEKDDAKKAETKPVPVAFQNTTFVMVDAPPFSPQLVARLEGYMGVGHQLKAILITSRDGIHYDEAPAVYTARRADLVLWKRAFPDLEIVAYRLDVPRDCRDSVTQILDGQGPFALHEEGEESLSTTNTTFSFVESGRPLTFEEWDHETAQQVLSGEKPPDDESDTGASTSNSTDDDDDDEYSLESIRAKEEGKRVLAVYTPGHSFGSLSFVFPNTKVCCSGLTLPVEDTRVAENQGMEGAGPALDARGYITTSRAGIARKMESAQNLVSAYSDRFQVILPSRGEPLFLGNDAEERKEELFALIEQYKRIGQIYEQLGITSANDDDDMEDL